MRITTVSWKLPAAMAVQGSAADVIPVPATSQLPVVRSLPEAATAVQGSAAAHPTSTVHIATAAISPFPAETSRRSAAFTLPGLAVVRLAAAAISRSPTAKSPQRAATRAVPESAAVSGPAAAISRSRAVKLKPPAATLLPGLAAAMAATGPTLKFPAAKSPQKAA